MERIFLGSNTKNGFIGYYEEAIKPLDRVIMLKGGAGTGKSSLMKKTGAEALAHGYDVEKWYCSGDPSSLDGIYVPERSFAMVDATAPHMMDPTVPIAKEKIICLADYLAPDKLIPNRGAIEQLLTNKKRCFIRAYEHLNIAFGYKLQSDALVREHANTFALTSRAIKFADELNERAEKCGRKKTVNRRLFNRAITPDGLTEFYDCLFNKEIVWVRGAEYSREIFFEVLSNLVGGADILLNPLVGDKVEGIIVGDFAVVSYVGHCEKDVSEVIDLGIYEGAADVYATREAELRRDSAIADGVSYLSRARDYHLEVERFYVAAMDFDAMQSAVWAGVRSLIE